jgi:hypothetical protein
MGCYLIIFLNQTPIFYLYMLRYDQGTNTIRPHVWKILDYAFKFYKVRVFTLNNEHNGKDLCIQVRNQQTSISNNHN